MKNLKNVKLVNLTPHNINVMDENKNILQVIESSGIARCKEIIKVTGSINNVDIIEKSFGEVEGLLSVNKNTYYIVSMLVATALKGQRSDLLIPGNVVRNEKGQVIGCTSLAVI